jgi:hypothetical protein
MALDRARDHLVGAVRQIGRRTLRFERFDIGVIGDSSADHQVSQAVR